MTQSSFIFYFQTVLVLLFLLCQTPTTNQFLTAYLAGKCITISLIFSPDLFWGARVPRPNGGRYIRGAEERVGKAAQEGGKVRHLPTFPLKYLN